MAFRDPRSCLLDFFQTGRNLGRRPPSLSLRNVQRDIRNVKTSIENIGDRIEGAIGAATRGEFLPGQLLSITNEFRCPPTPYANYFSQFRPPKLKFLFFATLELYSDFQDAFGGTTWSNGEMWWFIKQSNRPNVSYEWEEVNKYNFRTKVLRRATLEPIQMQMYDDLRDVSHSFWNTFIRLSNPITNLGLSEDVDREDKGMEWTVDEITNDTGIIRSANGTLDPPLSQTYSAGTGALPGINQRKTILKKIQIHHVLNWGRQIVTYTFSNPRITEIRLDELTWEDSAPNMVDVTFEYDAFDIAFPNAFTEEDTTSNKIPPAFPLLPQYDETPIKAVNEGFNAFNNTVNRAVDSAAKTLNNTIGTTIPGVKPG